MMKDSADKRASDSQSIEEKTSAKAGLQADLVKANDDKKSTTSELMATGEYLSSLHGECDWLLKNFGLRKEEIGAHGHRRVPFLVARRVRLVAEELRSAEGRDRSSWPPASTFPRCTESAIGC